MSGIQPQISIEGDGESRAPEPQAAAAPPQSLSKSPLAPASARGPDAIEYEMDSLGRRIGAKIVSALDMFELTLLLGAEHGANSAALNQAMMASSVVSIDGEALHRPVSALELKARIQRLGFPGYLAAATAVKRLAPDEMSEAMSAAIKN